MLTLITDIVTSVIADPIIDKIHDMTDDCKMRKSLLKCVDGYIRHLPDCGCSMSDDLEDAINHADITLIQPQTSTQLKKNLTSILGGFFNDDKVDLAIKNIAEAYVQVLCKYADTGDIFQQNEALKVEIDKLISMATINANTEIRSLLPVYAPEEKVERLKQMHQPHYCFLDEVDNSKIWFSIALYLYGDIDDEYIEAIADEIDANSEILDRDGKFICVLFDFPEKTMYQGELRQNLRSLDHELSQNQIMLLNFILD